MNKDLLSHPQNSSTSVQENIDLMTGYEKQPKTDPFKDMTDEEKERESEKLFVLFDRLNKTGVFKPINPFELKDPSNK